MEKKYIHYCWFGTKPLPRLAKKCIKSWKKYLPDYEIVKWSEENVDINECPFIKEAYDNKKWAFVADYARTKAIYEMGGIYFDTDMKVVSNIDFLLDKETFLGIEDSGMVNAAVWGTSKPKTKFAKEMLDFYRSQEHFNAYDVYSYSIPRIMSRILEKYGFEMGKKDIQILNNNIYIYPRDYFYPLSYNYQNNIYTDNTCMVHYFDASWIPKWEQRENKIFRRFGQKNGQRLINGIRFSKRCVKKIVKFCFYPFIKYKKYRNKINEKYLNTISNACSSIIKCHGDYIVFHNPEWFGVTNATIELFDNTIPCGEILRKKDIEKIGELILNNNIKQVIFSAMCVGWGNLAKYLKGKNRNIKVKVFWHGNHSQVSEPYGWARNLEIIELHKQGIIDVFGTCKKSLINFYNQEGLKTAFITNKVDVDKNIEIKNVKNKKTRIGLYAAKSDDWRKNMFTQIAAVSLLDDVVLDMVPLNEYALKFANILGLEVDGIKKSLPREELLKRMSNNDLNLYVTFSECSPMLPLESFEVGVPCLTGNNHHYFVDDKLEDYLVVRNEESANEIKEKILKCLNDKDKVLTLFEEWSRKNKIQSKNDVKNFLEM
ncbi:MAG: hypothetical protein J6D28_04795 [Bacilli bacterium]|nr:hypothetical protein [Bacilli bacterium]